jgi:hypothetical protein
MVQRYRALIIALARAAAYVDRILRDRLRAGVGGLELGNACARPLREVCPLTRV